MARSSAVTSRLDPRLGNPEWTDNWTVGPGLRFELIDSDGRVWLCHEPVTKEQALGLPLPGGAAPALLGRAIADVASFSRSPGAANVGPLDTMEVDGLRFSFVARPGDQRRVESATILSVDKHHTLLYSAGRTIEVLDFGDGTFAAPAWSAPSRERSASTPSGWERRDVHLRNDLIVVIPCPADVVIFDDGFGFHGPLPSSQLESAVR